MKKEGGSAVVRIEYTLVIEVGLVYNFNFNLVFFPTYFFFRQVQTNS
jgi:hypothetical protein